ncbi:phosphatidylglycerol lysyltransferase domain-containing protein [Candidatus Parcubacteria bacterium]|nr:DUF2156 domain-containing protein [Patescibacteria group bacterium]MBU4380932.1 DUF2156 domain-containing protein [Patescibacteria group bacterium]MCG2689450.1 phosphatidylglycerol lysyltransferase domain-containing protein [Candidatus Parcubacteria bacterium]
MLSTGYSYPNFCLMSSRHLGMIKKYLKDFYPYSDFNPVSILCWDYSHQASFSVLDGNLVIALKNYLKDSVAFSFLGTKNVHNSVTVLLRDKKELRFVPKEVCKILENYPLQYNIHSDRDSFDYVLDIPLHKNLSGNKFKSLRRQVVGFKKAYPDSVLRLLDLKKRKEKKQALQLRKKWCLAKGFNRLEAQNDIYSINKFFEIERSIDSLNFGLFIKDKLIAFTLNEKLENGWCMGHFGCSDADFDGASYHLEYEELGWLEKNGCRYLNMQQDTGISGLREYKNTFRPDFFLEKFTVSRKSL